jgi:hypothetical protein
MRKHRIIYLAVLLVALLSAAVAAQDVQLAGDVSRPLGSKIPAVVEAPPLKVGPRYESDSRKDPFLNPVLLRKQSELQLKADGEAVVSLDDHPPGITGMYIAQIALVGVSAMDAKRTAVFRGTDRRAYFLQEGDRVFDGYLRKIGTEDVLMIRETKLKSGKVLAQEVSKRMRTP